MIDQGTVLPGDVIAVRTTGITGLIIRIGSEIHNQTSLDNHIAIMHHTDPAGVPWCIEARPGGVGWRDARDYINSKYTVTNRNQPGRTGKERETVCLILEQMIRVEYDWKAIAQDAVQDLHIPQTWSSKQWGSSPPAHVVCSSLAGWAYHKAGWDYPMTNDPADIQPSDWLNFILVQNYE